MDISMDISMDIHIHGKLAIHGHFTKTLSSATLRLTRTYYQHG